MQGVIGKIKPAMVIQVIRINFNQSNKIFTYQKWYLKNIHKFHQPLQVVGAARGQKSKKEVCNRREVNSIQLNRMNCLHASNKVRSRLINAVTYCQTVGPVGGEKAKIQSATEGHLNAVNSNI